MLSTMPKDLLQEALLIGQYLLTAHDKFKMHLWARQAWVMKSVAEIEHKLGLNKEARNHANKADEILLIANGITVSQKIFNT